MNHIVRTSFYVATGGVIVGGSIMSVPFTAPLLAVAGIGAGTIVAIKYLNNRQGKPSRPPKSPAPPPSQER